MNTSFKINCNPLIRLIFYCNLHFYKIAKIFFSVFVSNIKNAIFLRHFMCFLTEFLQPQEVYGWVNRGSERLSTKYKIIQLLEGGIHIHTALRKKVSGFLWEWWLERESTRVLQSCPLFHGNEVQPQSFAWFASIVLGFPGGSVIKTLPANVWDTKDTVSIPEPGRSPGGGKWQPTPIFLPEKFHGGEEPGGLQSMGSQRVGHDWAHTQHSLCHSAVQWRSRISRIHTHTHIFIDT